MAAKKEVKSTKVVAKKQGGLNMTDYEIAGLLASFLLIYLIYALMKPEAF